MPGVNHMNWRVLRAFPKYAIVVGVIVLSSALFFLWYYFSYMRPNLASTKRSQEREAAIQKKAATLPDRLESLVLVGQDLYDIEKPGLLFENWLNGVPKRLFYHPDSNRLFAQVQNGIMRFGLDGREDGVMAPENGSVPAYTNDGKVALFVRNGDIWTATPDWREFRLKDERQATHYGQFYAPYFAENVILASASACLVQVRNDYIRVDLKTGDLKPVKLSILRSRQNRAPDCQFILCDMGEQLAAYHVDQIEPIYLPREGHVYGWQWLNNDVCAFLIGGETVSMYERKKNTVSIVAKLPSNCSAIGKPSPDGRYVLCSGRPGMVLIDTKEKTATPLSIEGAQHITCVSANALIFSREVADTSSRGTWVNPVGKEEQRILPEPYTVGYDGKASVSLLEEQNSVVFSTRERLFRMRPEGAVLREIAKLQRPGGLIKAVETWGRIAERENMR